MIFCADTNPHWEGDRNPNGFFGASWRTSEQNVLTAEDCVDRDEFSVIIGRLLFPDRYRILFFFKLPDRLVMSNTKLVQLPSEALADD